MHLLSEQNNSKFDKKKPLNVGKSSFIKAIFGRYFIKAIFGRYFLAAGLLNICWLHKWLFNCLDSYGRRGSFLYIALDC